MENIKKEHIVMVSGQFMPEVFGGAEQQCLKLSKELKQLGYEITILTSRSKSSVKAEEQVDGINMVRLMCWESPNTLSIKTFLSSLIWWFKSFFWLRKHKDNFSVIHAHQVKFNAFVALFAAKHLKKRSIIKVGNSGKGFDLDTVRRKKIVGTTLYNYIIKNVDLVIAISTDIKGELLAAKIPESKILFIPNGVYVNEDKPVELKEKLKTRSILELPIDKRLFTFVGRLEKQKEVLLLAKAFHEVVKSNPNIGLVYIGDGVLRTELETYIAQNSLQDNILLIGYTKKVHKYLKASDFFILSTKSEGLSNALLEAMSTGLPAISTSVSGSKDLITVGVNGYLTEISSMDSMKFAIEKAVGLDEEAFENFRKESFKTIIQNYKMELIAKKYDELYQKILNQ